MLVDHGHFQYNCVALGLVVWAVTFALDDRHIACGVCFALALNFKQTLLYYAPAFFFYLLGQCLFQRRRPILSILQLGLAVAAVFVVSWWYVRVGYTDVRQRSSVICFVHEDRLTRVHVGCC